MTWIRVAVALLTVLGLAAPAHAATTDVSMSQTGGFSPAVVRGRVGDSVTWHKTDGYHSVVSSQGMFSSGSPSTSEFTFTRTFSAGVFPYLCAVHPQTMRGSVRMKPRATAGPDGPRFRVSWATSETNTGSTFTVQYRVDDGSWTTWLRSTSARSRVFGTESRPAPATPGTLYRFRVKSRSGDNASSYSPAVAFTP